jgi:beta-lactamase class A
VYDRGPSLKVRAENDHNPSMRTLLVMTLAGGLVLASAPLHAGAVDAPALQAALERLAQGFDGRVGACVRDGAAMACVNGEQRFSLQSVMKLPVAMAVLDKVDRDGWRLDEPVRVTRQDLSVGVQPIAKLVGDDGFRTTVGDLLRRAIVDSDSAATDVLVARLGGIAAVQAYLDRHRVTGLRIDRDERRLQTETQGVEWRPEFVDEAALNRAIEAIGEAARDAAYRTYQADPRDTSTPAAMATLLADLAAGRLLSAASTRHLIEVLEQTATFPNRLRAGAAPGWRVGHKTGSSGARKGLAVATNDVGILTAPDGARLAVAAFVGDSREPAEKAAAVIAGVSRAAVASYRK